MPNESQKFQQILDATLEFAQARDVDLLLEKILSTAKNLANAEAGSIYINEEDVLRFHHTQHALLHSHLAPGENAFASSLPAVPSDSIAMHVFTTSEMVNLSDVIYLPPDIPYRFYPPAGEGTYYAARSVFAFPLLNTKQHILGVIELINLKNETGSIISLPEDDFPLVYLFANNAATAIERARGARTRIMGILQVLTTLRNTEETIGHFNRVSAYAAEIYAAWASKKNIPAETIAAQKDLLRTAAMLHDIGKLAIPNIIRGKPGKLTAEEYETMKQHTVKGAQLLCKYGQSDVEKAAADIALNHHEHWDGSGYPGHVNPESGQVIPEYADETGQARGKKGEEIPVFGRVVAIADVYDALRSRRIYRDAWQETEALEEIKKGSGALFDPDMVDAFFASLETIRAITQRYAE